MQNYIQPGDAIDITLGSGETAVASGKGYVYGVMFGVVSAVHRNGQTVFNTAASASGDVITLRLSGVVLLPKVTGTAIGAGVKVYYDATANNITTTSSGNTFAGYAVAAELSAATTVKVRLWQI